MYYLPYGTYGKVQMACTSIGLKCCPFTIKRM